MREIKFKVWDRKHNRMSQSFSLGRDSNIVFNDRCICGVEITGNDFVYLQFTGLKDRNGKEIYEGDICKYLNIYTKNEIWVVAFEDAKFVLKKSPMRFDLGDVDIQCVEVLGNTYENPELCNA